MMSAGMANKAVICSEIEVLRIAVPSSMTCESYLGAYREYTSATIVDMKVDGTCGICPLGSTNVFLDSIGVRYEERWHNLGIFVAFIGVNVVGTFLLHWLARVPKKGKGRGR